MQLPLGQNLGALHCPQQQEAWGTQGTPCVSRGFLLLIFHSPLVLQPISAVNEVHLGVSLKIFVGVKRRVEKGLNLSPVLLILFQH